MKILRKVLLSKSDYPISYYEDEVDFTFYTMNGWKETVVLSLSTSQPLESLVEQQGISYESLAKQGIARLSDLSSKEKQYFYRYMIVEDLKYVDEKYLIVFGFVEHREYYDCQVFGVLEIEV